ncbi:hypothetical protein HPP92_002819 [Vanilla planifolia]|uniref:Uncharacterized protein n=1 Tax=Vanilla planifolia TaxID=51239 RepID=A0A835VIB5_VANPL|nr:hypothetical protein HPP92_002819 [Vanilla planifolia]
MDGCAMQKQIFCSSVQGEVRNLVMHGHETGFSHFLITEVDSMGGVVDFGVGLDIKTSPHRAAITKAQEELRLEYDVREECRRELEFLEKGGNPLDFKLGRAASISLQSTSFTDQPVENETKRSFALPSSPHGDSAESSGHHGGSICQEPNIADNLVLFGNGKSNKGGEKSAKRTGKRTNLNPLEKASQVDAHHNLKDSSDSLISRLGANGQAYARRNRSRSSRDNHVNKCLTLPTSSGDFRDAKGLQRGVHAEEHAVSSVSNSKSDAPVKDSSITYVSEREIDVDKTENMSSDNTKGFANVVATTTSEKVQVIEHDVVPVERATCGSANQPSQLIALDYASVAFPSATPGVIENTSSSHPVKENDCNVSDVDLIDLHDDYMKDKKNVSDTSELVREKNINMDPAHLVTRFPNGDVVADDSVLRTDASREEETCRMPSTCSILTGRIQLTGSVVHTGSDKSICLPANLGNSVVHVKDEKVPFEVDGDNIIEKSLPNIKCSEARKSDIYLGESFHAINTPVVTTSTEDPSLTIAKTVSSILPNLQNREAVQVKLSKKDHESAVLSEARIIEANLKRAAALSKSSLSTEKRHKCHWDYVLEEMAWMANDFMQERIWKRTAAAQVSQFIASVGRSKFEQELLFREQKNIARTLAKAVMHFWRSTKAVHAKCGATSSNNKDCDGDPCDLSNANGFDIMKDQGVENHGQFLPLGIQSYALRFLNYISTTFNDPDPVMTEATYTTKRINGAVISESMDDQHSGESLFYKVPPGAMLSYRESVESQWANYKKLGNIVCREDCEASLCGSITDGPRASAFEEDEGETGPGIVRGTFEGNFSFKLTSTKKKKLQQRLYTQTFYEGGHDSSYGPYPVGKSANQSLPSIGKRPSSTINVGMAPTKRTRTAARQRIINPFGTGVTGVPQMTSRTDGSSGDTSSFQDDQCSMHGDSQLWKHLEVESTADFGRRLPFVGIERPSKSKKKRKSKQLGYKGSLNLDDSGIMAVSRRGLTFEHRLHADFMMQQDQRDLMEKRSESQPFEPNGNPGFYGQHVAKKAKFMKHADCNEQTALAGGAILSPVASQMSNMSNSNKLIRIMNHRDRGRKSKAMKVAAGQSGSGSAWSSFEDQALVVLVHDMGLNWGLVSDALNSTLLFKCIYRKPEDCKERHKFLMDRSAGDGADSAEDSGSSQPYQSTLPGIPKGSARQLFQRLHGPMEEDTLKSRFEKIILIGQRLHSCRIQGNNQDSKKITPAHGSHVLSLSQAYPNNLAGAVLSPLDLCDAVTSPDINTHGCHGSYSTGIADSRVTRDLWHQFFPTHVQAP